MDVSMNESIKKNLDAIVKREKSEMTEALERVLQLCKIGVRELEYDHDQQIVAIKFAYTIKFVNVNMDSPSALMLDVIKALKEDRLI